MVKKMISIRVKLLIKQLLKNKEHVFDMSSIEDFRETIDNMNSKVKIPKGVNLEEIQIGDIPAEKYILQAKDSEDSSSKVMLYLHGGGYIFGSYKAYRSFVSKLCKKLHVNAYCINYRLAPENPFPAGLNDAFFTYKWLLEEKSIPPENIIIMGDSAGAGLALALLVRIKSHKLPQPNATICLSPFTDLTLKSETMITKLNDEVFFNIKNIKSSVEAYLGNESPENPEVSPLFANFKGFPPTFIQVGSREVLLDDSLVLARKMREQEVSVTLDVQEGMFHAFLFFAQIPFIGNAREFRRAMRNIQNFVKGL